MCDYVCNSEGGPKSLESMNGDVVLRRQRGRRGRCEGQKRSNPIYSTIESIDDGELGGRRQPVEEAEVPGKVIIIRRGLRDWPETLRCWGRSGRDDGHHELLGSLRTVKYYDEHELS